MMARLRYTELEILADAAYLARQRNGTILFHGGLDRARRDRMLAVRMEQIRRELLARTGGAEILQSLARLGPFPDAHEAAARVAAARRDA